MPREGGRKRRVLEHTAELSHARERGGKRSSVITSTIAVSRLYAGGQVAPPRARRGCHDAMRTGIEPRVARFRPEVDAFEPGIASVRIDVECSDHGG